MRYVNTRHFADLAAALQGQPSAITPNPDVLILSEPDSESEEDK